jgi:hypothetical protein
MPIGSAFPVILPIVAILGDLVNGVISSILLNTGGLMIGFA